MRNIFLVVSILITFQFAYAQTGLIGTPGVNEYAPTVAADNNGNTYIGGSRNTELLIIKRNSLGEILWSNTIPTGVAGIGIELNDLLLVGDTLFGCGETVTSNQIEGGAYFKINASTGTCYWLKYDLTSETYYSSVQYYQGKIVLIGSNVSYASTSGYDGKVIAVNSTSGNLIWQTPIFGLKFTSSSADYIDDFQSSTTIENGKMFLTGRSYVNGAPVNMRATLIGIDVDNNGSIFLSKYLMYNIATDFSRVYGTSIQRDGSELILGFMGDYLCSGCTNYRTGLLKCDLNGNVIWSKYYDIGGATGEFNKSVNVTPDGYVIYGHATFGSLTRLILLKVDNNGNFVLGKSVGQTGQNLTTLNGATYNLACASDFKNGVHHFVGNRFSGNPSDRDIFYLKADNTTLQGENSCFTYQNLTVNTTVIPPFSGNLITTSDANSVAFSTTSSTTAVVTSSCPNITVTQTHSNSCGSDTIVISVTGLTNPVITWSNGVTGNQVVATQTDTLIATIHDPNTCCSYQEIVVPDFQPSSSVLDINLPADTSVCLSVGDTYTINTTVPSGQSGITYSWNSGETTQSIEASVSGTYIVTALAGCSEGSDTIVLTVNNTPTVDFGADLELCSTEFPYDLNPGSTNVYTWSWSTGETTSSITINQPGTISVEVSNECGTDTDEVIITEVVLPEVDLISEIDTCLNQNEGLLVNATVTGSNNTVWSNGQTGATTEVFNSGTYTISATNGCGTVGASVDVIINHFPEVDLGSDLALCSTAFPYVLNAVSPDSDTWLWSTGETTSSITIDQPGTFGVEVSNECGTDNDEVVITEMLLPEIDLVPQIDTCLNPNENLLVSATITGASDIVWSTGETGMETQFTESGTYTVLATNDCGTVSSSIVVGIYRPLTQELPTLIASCEGYVILSDYISPAFDITSSDVDLSNKYVSQNGWIYCSIETECGNYADSVYIDIKSSDLLYLQNSFTPNNDGVNDVYQLMVPDIHVVSIEIFNRWGEMVYHEDNAFSGWDGTYKGKKCPDGIYQVQLVYTECRGLNATFNGHVNLLK